MNILLWVLQILLALWNVIGGFYVANNYDKIANSWALNTFPGPAWIVLGILQVLLAAGLLLPGARFRKSVSVAAAALGVLALLGIGLYTQYSGFPGMLWGAVPALVATFVAYKRWRTLPAGKEQS